MGKLTVVRLVIFTATIASTCTALAEDGYSLQDLVGTKIYSASKKEENPNKSPSAIYVITAEDIARIGARHVADALRTVPGLQVSKITSNKWMVASRGFGEQFSNKLLVLVDGRPIYTTLFSGVLWFQHDIPIADVKQIEVVRGPGATLWGSNAVNGVINIITKSTKETLGARVHTTFGITDNGETQKIIEAQKGQEIDDAGTFRVTLKGREDPSYTSVQNGTNYEDGWHGESLNFRFDSKQNVQNSYKVTGAVFNSDSTQTYTYPTLVSPYSIRTEGVETSRGGYINGEITNELDAQRSVTITSYLDYTDWYYAGYNPSFLTGSLGAQYNLVLFDTWETITGSSYKFTSDHVDDSPYLLTNPDSRITQFLDAFAQSKIPLIPNRLYTTLGARVESNSYDTLNLSPSAKLSWEPDPLVMTWLSWSRASRIPSRNTFDLTTYSRGTAGGYIALIPSEDFKSEDVTAYEGGIRLNPLPGLQVNTSVFYNEYDNLRTFLAGPAMAAPIGTPLYITNAGYAHNRGIEITGSYQTTPSLQLNASYSHHDLNFKADPGLVDTVYLNSGRKWAKDTVTGGFSYALNDDITANFTGYHYSDQPAMDIPAYYKADGNVAWRVIDGIEVIGGVDNISDNLHPEYSAQLFGESTEVPRLYYVTLKLEL